MFSSDDDFNRPDWALLQNGAVNLFWQPEVLADAKRDLEGLGYDIAEASCAAGVPSFHAQMSRALKWQKQFGYEPWTGNLDAFNDGMRGYSFGPSGRGALVLTGFHHLAAADPYSAHAVLDILEYQARNHLLSGNLLVVLVQTDDADYRCANIGGRPPQWNWRELLNSNRGL